MDKLNNIWLILVPLLGLIYTFIIREYVGPGYSTAPNQGAMVMYGMLSILWVAVAIGLTTFMIRRMRSKTKFTLVLSIICALGSSYIPFYIGMK